MATVSEALATAMKHHQSGQLQIAEQIYRQILQTEPHNVDALHLLGLIAHQAGNHQAAVDLIGQAIRLNANAADAHGNLGLAYFAWGKVSEAIGCYRRALNLKPGDLKNWMMLGIALKHLNQFDEAISCFQKAVQLKPDLAEAFGNMGNAYKEMGRLNDAIDCYRKVISINPKIAEAYSNLALVLQEQGNVEEAITNYRRAIEQKPTFAEAYGSLGNALKEQGRLEEAATALRRALELKPNLVEAHGNLGIVLMDQGYPEKAIASYQTALHLRPDDPITLSNLGNAFTNRSRLTEAVACFQKALELTPNDATVWNNLGTALKDQGTIDEAIASYRKALQLRPDNAMAHSNLLMTLQYQPDITLAALATEHREFDRRHAISLRESTPPRNEVRDKRQLPRLGFISADLARHPVGFFLLRTVENLFRENFEMIFYSDRVVQDDFTRRFQSVSKQWHDTFGASDQRLAEQIRADEIDILFDLSGHTGHNRIQVFARKPAPIAITWIGYEGTTGLSAMDYLIADTHVVVPGTEEHFCEEILRMPDGYLCYEPPDNAPPVSPPPLLTNGYATFGSFNNLAKISPNVIETWSEILRLAPRSRLIMQYQGLGDATVRQRYLNAFTSRRVDAGRIEFRQNTSYAEYLSSYSDVDLVLDAFPFSGSTTTCEALWMGVPVVTRPMETFASRHGLTHLTNIGLTETIAKSLDDYIDIAVSCSTDISQLQTIRSTLRERMAASPLCDGKRFAKNLSTLLMSVWNG